MSAGVLTGSVSSLKKELHLLRAQALDVKSAAADEMLQPFHRLGRADQAAGAATDGIAFLAVGGAAAFGAKFGKT